MQGGDEQRGFDRGRSKKLLAGIRFSLWLSDAGSSYDCSTCTTRERDNRNCNNRKERRYAILDGPQEWGLVPASLKPVLKIHRSKFFVCPMSVITPATWEMLRLTNACLTAEGDIACLPVAGGWLDQPRWFHQAVEIVRSERNRHRKEQFDRQKSKARK